MMIRSSYQNITTVIPCLSLSQRPKQGKGRYAASGTVCFMVAPNKKLKGLFLD
jgi:hypothetical protein